MENSVAVDRISDLPDEVLYHILSCLPIKHAFATSILSKRWTPLCYLLTVLRFDDESVRDREAFLCFHRFVDAIMLSPRVHHQPIKTFHFRYNSGRADRLNVNRWVETAKRRRMQDLDVSLSCQFTLAPSTFSCPTLVVLKLKKLLVANNIVSVDLPSLKTLHLESVTLQNSEDLKKLLSGCPVLEDLHTDLFYVKGGSVRPGGFKTLSKLVRSEIFLFDVPFNAIYNVQFLRVVKIKERIPEEIDSCYNGFPIFGNLIHLELWLYDFNGWDNVVEMLQYCPKLQILFVRKWTRSDNLYINWEYTNPVPECFSSQLRSCTINYEHFEDELRFAAYILLNAPLLQVMTIRGYTNSLKSMQKAQLLEKLSLFPRISRGCKFSLEFF